MVFHLTARTQGHEPWFTEGVRTRIAEYAADAIRVTDSLLLAWAVMPSHLHLVVLQGDQPLGDVMHPLLSRIALLMHRVHSIEGHVFERRFRDLPCRDAEHVRNAIVYVHLNPVRSGLVDHAGHYLWTSHSAYVADHAGLSGMHGVCRVETGLSLFAPREGLDVSELRQAYRRCLGWRVEKDRRLNDPDDIDAASRLPGRPGVRGGNAAWASMCDRARARSPDADAEPRPDLTSVANRLLVRLAPEIPLELVRSRCKQPRVVRVRRHMVWEMTDLGYSGKSIARFLRVTPQCVSNIRAARNGAH
jgi:REP element-mobilizing transposase RayT